MPDAPSETLKIVFMGTAPLSCDSLEALVSWPGCQVTAVVTQPDRPKGRDLKLQPSAVKESAMRQDLPILQPARARDEAFISDLRRLNPDLIVVAAYGQILPQPLLDIPRFGCLNVHTSLLPKYRGAAPIQWAILNDEPETGVTIMKMDAGLDTGDILSQQPTAITADDTSETLHSRLADLGAELLVRTIPAYVAGSIRPRPQAQAEMSYAPKIKKEDGRLDWRRPARALWNQIRGLVPWPGAFTFLPNPPKTQLLKIWQAQVSTGSGAPGEILKADKNGILVGCGQQGLLIQSLQREGGRRLTAQEFLAGYPLNPGSRFE